ncbi:hypothetical protein QTN25_003013 [Entamoeba marina]
MQTNIVLTHPGHLIGEDLAGFVTFETYQIHEFYGIEFQIIGTLTAIYQDTTRMRVNTLTTRIYETPKFYNIDPLHDLSEHKQSLFLLPPGKHKFPFLIHFSKPNTDSIINQYVGSDNQILSVNNDIVPTFYSVPFPAFTSFYGDNSVEVNYELHFKPIINTKCISSFIYLPFCFFNESDHKSQNVKSIPSPSCSPQQFIPPLDVVKSELGENKHTFDVGTHSITVTSPLKGYCGQTLPILFIVKLPTKGHHMKIKWKISYSLTRCSFISKTSESKSLTPTIIASLKHTERFKYTFPINNEYMSYTKTLPINCCCIPSITHEFDDNGFHYCFQITHQLILRYGSQQPVTFPITVKAIFNDSLYNRSLFTDTLRLRSNVLKKPRDFTKQLQPFHFGKLTPPQCDFLPSVENEHLLTNFQNKSIVLDCVTTHPISSFCYNLPMTCPLEFDASKPQSQKTPNSEIVVPCLVDHYNRMTYDSSYQKLSRKEYPNYYSIKLPPPWILGESQKGILFVNQQTKTIQWDSPLPRNEQKPDLYEQTSFFHIVVLEIISLPSTDGKKSITTIQFPKPTKSANKISIKDGNEVYSLLSQVCRNIITTEEYKSLKDTSTNYYLIGNIKKHQMNTFIEIIQNKTTLGYINFDLTYLKSETSFEDWFYIQNTTKDAIGVVRLLCCYSAKEKLTIINNSFEEVNETFVVHVKKPAFSSQREHSKEHMKSLREFRNNVGLPHLGFAV